jgi:CRISPR system Cascade subunit CasE
MYLSRLILNPRSRQVRREADEPYELHRTIMRAFPAAANGGPGRVLFRLDSYSPAAAYPRGGALTLLVQSEAEPDWGWLAGEHDYLLSIAGDNPAVKPYNPTFSAGQRLLFRLRANPTVKRNDKRLGLYREEEQRAWLARKAEESGFIVLTADVRMEGLVDGQIHRPDGDSHTLRLLGVRFDGLLQVVEPAQILQTIRNGVGSGKGLGFGLLSVARG